MSENNTHETTKPIRQFVQIECADCDAKAQATLEVGLSTVQRTLDHDGLVLVAVVDRLRIPDGWSQYGAQTRQGYTLAAEFRCLNHARAYADKNGHARSFGRDEAIVYAISGANYEALTQCADVIGIRTARTAMEHRSIEDNRELMKWWYREHRKSCASYEQYIFDQRMICALEHRLPKHQELMSLIKIAEGSQLDAVGGVLNIKRTDESDMYGWLLEGDAHYRERLVNSWDEKRLDKHPHAKTLAQMLGALSRTKYEPQTPDLQVAVQAAEASESTEDLPENLQARVEALEADLYAAREALLREGMERDQFRKALNFIAAAVFEPPQGTPNLPAVEERIIGQIEELYGERTARKTAEHEHVEAMRVVEELFYILNHKLTRKERSAIRMLGTLREQIGDLREMVTQRISDAKIVTQAAELIEDDRGETETSKALRALAKRIAPSEA